MKISPILTDAIILSFVLGNSSAAAIGRYEIRRVGKADNENQPIGKLSSVSPLDGTVYFEYNSLSNLNYELYGMLDQDTGNGLVAEAKCDAGTLLVSSPGYKVSGVSNDEVTDAEKYPNINEAYPATTNGKIGQFRFELGITNAVGTVTDGSNIDVCARIFITASTAASIDISTAPSISTVPSTAPSASQYGANGVCMNSVEHASGTSWSKKAWVPHNNDPATTCKTYCANDDYFGMECPRGANIWCNCISQSELNAWAGQKMPMYQCLGECEMDSTGEKECENRSVDGSRVDKGCAGAIIDDELKSIFDGYALGAAYKLAIYPVSNRRELQESSNKAISYLDTRFQVSRAYSADFNLNDINIADAGSNALREEDDVEVTGVTVKFCDEEYGEINQSTVFKLGQDFGVCVDPPDKGSDSLFQYTVTKLKDVNCATSSAIYPLIDSNGNPADDLTIVNDNTTSNGKRFVSVVQSAYFSNGNTLLKCEGRVELTNDRTRRNLEANIRLDIPSLESKSLVSRGIQESATQETEFGFSINLASDESDEASAEIFGGYCGVITTITIGVACIASLIL